MALFVLVAILKNIALWVTHHLPHAPVESEKRPSGWTVFDRIISNHVTRAHGRCKHNKGSIVRISWKAVQNMEISRFLFGFEYYQQTDLTFIQTGIYISHVK